MDLIFCKLKQHGFPLLQAFRSSKSKALKAWIQFFFSELWTLKTHELIFCKFTKAQNHAFKFYTSFYNLKNLKKHVFNFMEALKSLKNMNFIFASLKMLKKHGFNFLQKNARAKKSTDSLFWNLWKSKRYEFNLFAS